MRKSTVRRFAAVAAAVFAGVMVIMHPSEAVKGVGSGLETCVSVVVPSLFPFMVVSSFLSAMPVSDKLSKAVSPVMRYVFRLPAQAFPALLFGLTGGFPVGCSVAAELLSQGKIEREHAQRLTLFCVNPGPAFTVTAVGAVMLGSVRAGVLLFASVCTASLVTAVLLGFMSPVPPKSYPVCLGQKPVSAVLVNAVERSASAMLGICAWVTVFSCLFSLADAAGLSERTVSALRCICEVTGGCGVAAQKGNIYAVAAVVGWSGLCVICQVMGDVQRVGTPLRLFVAFRVVSAAMSAVMCRVLLCFFPIEASVFLSLDGSLGGEFFSASAPAAAALICLCAVFVIDLDRTRKMC